MTKYLEKKLSILQSFPLWGRGLKSYSSFYNVLTGASFPLWGRGLKYGVVRSRRRPAARRSPCGDVD